MHTKMETIYSYNTMNVLFKKNRNYVVIKAEDINKYIIMDIVEFFDLGYVDPRLAKLALRMKRDGDWKLDDNVDDIVPEEIRDYLEGLKEKDKGEI